MTPVALTIAGSDPSGGAGIQADLKTFHQFGVYGEAVLTLITVQNTRTVARVEVLPPSLVLEQLRAVVEDIPPAAAKTGALGGAELIEALAAEPLPCPLVVDPVMISKHGSPLLDPNAAAVFRRLLVPRAALITPNLPEAAALTGRPVETIEQMRDAARALLDLGATAALVKGGHLQGDAVDLLYDSSGFDEFRAARTQTPHTHGTGCTFSAAITAGLAAGCTVRAAVAAAKHFISAAIGTNPGLGHGAGPVNHHAPARSVR